MVRPLPLATPLSLKQPPLGRGGGERGGVAVPVLLWIGGKGEGVERRGAELVSHSPRPELTVFAVLDGRMWREPVWLRRGSRLGCKLTEISQLKSGPAPSSEGKGRGSGFRKVQFIYTQPRERRDGRMDEAGGGKAEERVPAVFSGKPQGP